MILVIQLFTPVRLVLLLPFILLLGDAAAVDGKVASDWTARITRAISSDTPALMRKLNVPGVSIAMVESGRISWTGVFGVANADTGKPVETNTLFEAASMSKPLFAYAALKLVERGVLDLDRPLVEYLDEPYLPDQPQHRLITARMVMNHTSGFPNWRPKGWLSKNPLQVRFKPGMRYGYSGEGFLYLQRVVEHMSGKPLQEFMRSALLNPLGMDRSSYRWEVGNSARIAAGHNEDGSVRRADRRYDQANAAYSLFTTPSEYAEFLIEMMRPLRTAPHSLGNSMLSEMLKPTVATGDGRQFGLGWWKVNGSERTIFAHTGSNGSGFRCCSHFEPTFNRGLVIMCNGIGGKTLYQTLLKRIERAWVGGSAVR